jgi:hypothetical protein
MLPPFDLFREEPDGSVLWIGIASSLEEAQKKIAGDSHPSPCEYLIVSLKTGKRQTVRPSVPQGEPPV